MARSLRPGRHCGRFHRPAIARHEDNIPGSPRTRRVGCGVRLDHLPLRLGHYAANLDGIEFGPWWQHVEGKIPGPPERWRWQPFRLALVRDHGSTGARATLMAFPKHALPRHPSFVV